MKMVRSLFKDEYDVLVATAGAAVHMLNNNELYLSMFSCLVLDEAHHGSGGNHMYSELLKILRLEPVEDRPRLLGLTASPFRVKTLSSGVTKLMEMKEEFGTDAIYKPKAPKLIQDTPERRIVRASELNLEFQKKLIEAYSRGVDTVSEEMHEEIRLKKPEKEAEVLNESDIGTMKGEINAVGEMLKEPAVKRHLHFLLCILDALEVTRTIGIHSALQLLYDNSIEIDSIQRFKSLPETQGSASRLQILRKLLRETKPDSKILVFVNTRVSARRLVKVLQEEFPEFQAEQVVGHGGWDGQRWEQEQEAIIGDFHAGRRRLLVCTSVLEEGIDVAACDLVIRYTGVTTLIQFIQSRGRARKDGSRFVVLVTEEEIQRSIDVEEEENILEMILDGHARKVELPSERTVKIIEKVQVGTLEGNIYPKLKNTKFSHLPAHSLIEFFVPHKAKLSMKNINERIEETLETQSLKLSRIEMFAGEARTQSSCPIMFDRKDHLVLCHVSPTLAEESMSGYHDICKGWDFKLEHGGQHISSKMSCRSNRNPKLKWNLSDVVAGSMPDRANFYQSFSFQDHHLNLSFFQAGHFLKIYIGSWIVELSLLRTSVQGFGLASWEKRHCALYIPIENIPNMFVLPEFTRVVDHPFLQALARDPVLMLKVNLEEEGDWYSLREIFASPHIVPFPVFDTKINMSILDRENINKDAANSEEDAIQLTMLDFEVKKSLLHAEWSILEKSTDLPLNVPDEFVTETIQEIRELFLSEKILEAQKIALAWSLSTRGNYSIWKPFQDIYQQQLINVENLKESSLRCLKISTPENHSLLLRLVITPSRHIFQPSIPVFTSRLTRLLSNTHNLVLVAFREENMQKIHDAGVYPRVSDMLLNGFRIMGRQFHFLCASASQIRDHKAFFVEVNCASAVYSLRKLIIADPEAFTVPAKYLSRLGLFCSADRPTIDIPWKEVAQIGDVRAADNSLVTDGSGFIKRSKAAEMFQILNEDIPSAFQFRLGGLKGVLTVVEDSYVEDKVPGASILYRPSQKKFGSDHKTIGVVKVANVHPLKLNREAITLMEAWSLSANESNTWNVLNTLINLQENFLETQGEMFVDSIVATETLMQYLPAREVKGNAENFDIKTEPFWFHLLRHCHIFGVSMLCKKTNIPVKNGCLVMGIPDFTDVLHQDEVFLQVCRDDEPPTIIEGSVLIYRNPCLHPGDIRLVTAVNKPELREIKNALVMPTKDQKTSLSGMCSGGDLDGDQFSVIWDKNIVPQNNNLHHEALDYGNLEGNSPVEQEGAWRQETLSQFYVDCMKNELLGRVAHMHLAHSDMAELGAADPASMKLAESQAVAVDYPKTGIAPQVPKVAMDRVKDTGYPDFMEKKRDVTYPSTKILGKLYQASRSFLFEYEISEEDYRKIPLDQAIVNIQGSIELLPKAEAIYNQYAVDMRYLMHQFSLRSEEEVVLGRAVRLHSLLDTDREKVYRSLKESYEALKLKYRDKILLGVQRSELQAMVSACYRVAYDQNMHMKKSKKHSQKMTERPFLSFPWIVGDYLGEIKKNTAYLPPKFREDLIHKEIGESVKSLFDANKLSLRNDVEEKEKIVCLARVAIEANATIGPENMFEVYPYGSSSVFLCEQNSDVDICVKVRDTAFEGITDSEAFKSLPETAQQRHFLTNHISTALDPILDRKVDLTKNDVPLIKGEIDSISIDISCNMEGMRKSEVLLGIFIACPEMFVVFWMIIKWARRSNLIRDLDGDKAMFPTADMYALTLHILKPKVAKIEPGEIKNMSKNLDSLLDLVEDFGMIGEKLHDFFRYSQCLTKTDLILSWGRDDIKEVLIQAANVSQLTKASSQALHCFRVSRDMARVLDNASDCTETETSMVKKLPLSLSHSIGSAPDFHARRWSFLSGARVEIVEESGEASLLLSAEGSRASLAELRTLLSDLTRTKRSLVIGVPSRQASRYFLTGSTLFLMRGNADPRCRVGFTDSQGTYQLHHQASQRSTTVRWDQTSGEMMETNKWIKERAVPSLAETMRTQLATFPLNNKHYVNTVEMSSRFGTFYTVNIDESLPTTQKSLSINEFQETCERGRSMRKVLERRKFEKVRSASNQKQNFKMVGIPTGKGQADISDNKKAKMRRMRRRKEGISMSYNTGVLNPVVENTLGPNQVTTAQQVYKKVLENLDFKPGLEHAEGSTVPQLPGHCLEEHWKVMVRASTGYEVSLNLDSAMNFKNLVERNMSWVHATIFHGNEVILNLIKQINNFPDDPIQRAANP